MAEPTLENIDDYNNLKGEKKRVVWAVVLSGLLIGVIYTVAYKAYAHPEDQIKVKETINSIPVE